MRAIFIIALLLSAIPASAPDRPCLFTASAYENPYYVVHVSHDAIAAPLVYTASPPATLIVQHYITDTFIITLSSTPLITHTIWTFDYSETTSLLGYSPLAPQPYDYAYTFRAAAPFRVWACAQGAQVHTFLPIVSR